ncbi:MAG: cold-shock protein [Bacteroidota bacterium]
MEKGTVKWFDEEKGFGYIKRLNGQDVFVHSNGIMGAAGYKALAPGDNVQFEVEKREKGIQAYRVVKVSF